MQFKFVTSMNQEIADKLSLSIGRLKQRCMSTPKTTL
jgi:hypothetical protein